MRRSSFYLALAFTALSGVYLRVAPSWTAVFRAHVVLHPALGVVAAVALGVYLVGHVREKGWSRSRIGSLLGIALTGVCLACAFSGLGALVLFGRNREWIRIHGWIGVAACAAFAVHVFRASWMVLRERSRWARWRERLRLPLGARVGALAVLAWLALVAVDRPTWLSIPIHFHDFLEHDPEPHPAAAALSVTGSCGGLGCHDAIVQEFVRSNHARSPETLHFGKITALLAEERGAPAARFCTSCHAPATALSPTAPSGANPSGLGCLTCHSMGAASLAEHPGQKHASGPRDGFIAAINADHLALFPAGGDTPPAGLPRSLIRLNPAAHARVMRPKPLESDEVCLACHQEHIPRRTATSFVQARCIDCHMIMQRPFSDAGLERPHLMLGANVVTPRLLGDAEMERKVTGWLTGDFETKALDAFWELRRPNQTQQSRAVWLFMAIEPLGPARPGETLPLRISTSNVGIGHPFPSGVVDLYDVWLELTVADADGTVVFRSGVPGGAPWADDGVLRLGGYVTDPSDQPIDRHRIWEQKERRLKAIDPSRTTLHEVSFPVPATARGPLQVTARWNYDRLNAPFVAWAYAGRSVDLPRIVVASVEQKIPLAVPAEPRTSSRRLHGGERSS